jgi:murein DD-endopeptidase MepM/ murein hydrolase activator NlpD
MRLIAIATTGVAVWLIAATQVPPHIRLALASVVPGSVLTQPFGCTALELEPFAPSCPTRHFHTGVDLAARLGAAVYSATEGVVIAGFDAQAGNFVKVLVDRHVRILYCHLSAFRVSTGDVVRPGQIVGLVGSTGLATGPHVHLQVNIDAEPVDPAWFLSRS